MLNMKVDNLYIIYMIYIYIIYLYALTALTRFCKEQVPIHVQ